MSKVMTFINDVRFELGPSCLETHDDAETRGTILTSKIFLLDDSLITIGTH